MLTALSIITGVALISSLSIGCLKELSWQSFVITLFGSTAPIPLLAYTNTLAIGYYLAAIAAIATILPAVKRKQYLGILAGINTSKKNYLEREEILVLITILSLSIFLTWQQAPWNWHFEGHDVLYYGWLNEVFKGDYDGPIRVTTAYPSQLSANHLLPGALLLPFVGLAQQAPFFAAYCAKYLLITASVACLGNALYKRVRRLKFSGGNKKREEGLKKLMFFFIVFITPFLFFGPELEYSASISSFSVIIPLFSAAALAIESRTQRNDTIRQLTAAEKVMCLFACACFAKASTSPVFLMSAVAALIAWKRLASKPKETIARHLKSIREFLKHGGAVKLTIGVGFAVLIILSWTVPISQHGSLALAPPLCLFNTFGEDAESLQSCLSALTRNPFDGWIAPGHYLPIIKNLPGPMYHFYHFAYIWLFLLIPLTLASSIVLQKAENLSERLFTRTTLFYGLFSGLAVVFLRESQNFSGAHTAHSYLLAATLLIPLVHSLLINQKIVDLLFRGNLIAMISTGFLGIIILYLYSLQMSSMIGGQRAQASNTVNQNIRPVASIAEINNFDATGCKIDPRIGSKLINIHVGEDGCADRALLELIHSIKNIRSITSKHPNSIINQWSIDNELKQ